MRDSAGVKRLLFLNNQGLASVGGGVTILRHLVLDLAQDFDVTVLSCDPPVSDLDNVRQIQVPAPHCRTWRFAPIARARHFARTVPKAELASADLVVVLDCHFMFALRAARLPCLLYLSLSCIPRQEWIAARGMVAALYFAQYAYLERETAKAASVVVVSSAEHDAELRRFERLPHLKSFVLHPVFEADGPRLARSLSGTTTLLCAGRLVPLKNYGCIIELAARLNDLDCKFVIAGDGPELQDLKNKTTKAGLSDRVLFVGETADVDALMASADVFVHPSRYESFGIAVFEAMRAGVPPVCSSKSVCGIREFLQNRANAILVDFDLPDTAAEAVRALITNPSRREDMGAAARTTAEKMLQSGYVTKFRKIISTLGIEATPR